MKNKTKLEVSHTNEYFNFKARQEKKACVISSHNIFSPFSLTVFRMIIKKDKNLKTDREDCLLVSLHIKCAGISKKKIK